MFVKHLCPLPQYKGIDMAFDNQLTDLYINRDLILIKDYLPTKFEV